MDLRQYTSAFLNLFHGREDYFAVQQDDGSYRPVNHPLREEDVKYHLFEMVSTYGVYLLQHDNCVNFCCIDIDVDLEVIVDFELQFGKEQGNKRVLAIAKNDVQKQSELLNQLNIPHAIEFSGRRGYHVWIFFNRPLPASFVMKLMPLITIKQNPKLSATGESDFYEFFPKQATTSNKGLGNLIKLPLGLHRVSEKRSYFIDNTTFEIRDDQFDYLIWLDQNGRVKDNYLEELLHEKINWEEYYRENTTQKRASGHVRLNAKFDFRVPDDTDKKFHTIILPEMKELVNRPPMVNNEFHTENVNKCPPCIYRCYIISKTKPKQFDSRIILVHYFANIKSKYSNYRYCYTPSDIAGFIKYEINNDIDNQYPERLKYYVSWAYGNINDPYSLEGCSKIQKQGFCINFNYEAIHGITKNDETEYDLFLHQLRETRKKAKENINDIALWESDKQKNPQSYLNIDLNDVKKEIYDDIEQVYTKLLNGFSELQQKFHKRNYKYEIKCERIWNPLSINNEYKKIKEEKNQYLYADILNSEKIDSLKEDSVEYIPPIPFDLSSNNEEISISVPVDDDGNDDEVVQNHDKILPKQPIKELQCVPTSEYSEIINKIDSVLRSIINSPHKYIAEIQKTTRVGVTTSLTLIPKQFGLRTLLCVPTNAIGLDTFTKTVKISEENAFQSRNSSLKIYGGVFGSNMNMCLKVYKQIFVDLLRKHGKTSIKDLAVVNDLPFIFKKTCVSTSKSGETHVCPFYNCIYIGYPRDREGNITPIVESQIPKVKKDSWCTYKNHNTKPNDSCAYIQDLGMNIGKECKDCDYFEREYEYIDKNDRPYCAYATIYRHLNQDRVNISVHDSMYISIDTIEQNHNENLIHLSRNEVKTLIDDGFIAVNSKYRDKLRMENNDIEDLEGLLDRYGHLKQDVQLIKDVQLKMFDTLTLTYTKILALYESIKNTEGILIDNPSEAIINAIKNNFHGVICDEVSHLVAQSPLSFPIYSVQNKLDMNGDIDKESTIMDFIEKINTEMTILTTKLTEKARTSKRIQKHDSDVSPIDYFIALKDHFIHIFGNMKKFIFTPNDIVELFDSDYTNQLNIRGKSHNKKAFDLIMDSVANNQIPLELKNHIRQLQQTGILKGKVILENNGRKEIKYTRSKVRYIDVAKIRIQMQKIVKAFKKIEAMQNISHDNNDDILDIDDEEIDEEVNRKIAHITQLIEETHSDYHTLLSNEYLELFHEIIIKEDEIAIVNEILFPFHDDISFNDMTELESFSGYEEGTYIIIGWGKVNQKIIFDCFKEEGVHENKINELFITMYTMLVNFAIDENIGLKALTNMLLLSNVDSFFIKAFSTNDYQTRIEFQSIPSFKKIVTLVNYILDNTLHEKYKNFAITTDATMPLIEMSSVFKRPTQIWKVGDPKQNCKKQLIIADTKNVSVNDLFNLKLTPVLTSLLDNDVNVSNINKFHIEIKNQDEMEIGYTNITKYLYRFRLFVFINMVAEQFGASDIFIISPNKTFHKLLLQGMYHAGKGIPIDPIMINWLSENYPNEFQQYLNKGWLKRDLKRSTVQQTFYSFYITEIGGSNDDGERQYYRGNRTIGTACDCRVMIAITSPSSPSNSYEWLSHFYYEQNFMEEKTSNIGGLTINELNKALRRTELQSSAFQTFSRVKDPRGNQPSVVFVWGVGSEEYQWAKCQNCGQNEIDIYNMKPSSLYNEKLHIQSDDIYFSSYQLHGKSYTGDLCYDCILKLNAQVLGISLKKRKNLSSDIQGVHDLLAYKIPIPKIVSTYTNKQPMIKHFLDSEYKMIENAVLWRKELPLPSLYLQKFRDKLMYVTFQKLKEIHSLMDYHQFTDDQLTELCAFPITELLFSFGSRLEYKMIKEEALNRHIKDFSQENLLLLNILPISKDGYVKYRIKDFSVFDINIRQEQRKKTLMLNE